MTIIGEDAVRTAVLVNKQRLERRGASEISAMSHNA